MKKLIFISLFTIALADCEDPNQSEYFISCDGGSYQQEVSWNLNPTGVAGGAPYSEYFCLSDGNYELRMFDSYGDGWNGNLWSIHKGDFDGDLVAQCSLDGDNQDWGECFFALGDSNQLTCEEMNGNQCISSSDCEWVENIDTDSCSSLSVQGYYTECDLPEYGSCYSDCTNWGNYYGGLFCYGTMYCAGGNYQTDNSYCQNNPNPPTCDEMTEFQCISDQGCDWIEDIEYGNCSNYNNDGSSCAYYSDYCSWDFVYWCGNSSCFVCSGGAFEVENSYCSENNYMQGDLNEDVILNILDVIIIINIILNQESNDLADMNDDQIINILDIIELINIILIN